MQKSDLLEKNTAKCSTPLIIRWFEYQLISFLSMVICAEPMQIPSSVAVVFWINKYLLLVRIFFCCCWCFLLRRSNSIHFVCSSFYIFLLFCYFLQCFFIRRFRTGCWNCIVINRSDSIANDNDITKKKKTKQKRGSKHRLHHHFPFCYLLTYNLNMRLSKHSNK